MLKSGIIINVRNKNALILTPTGEIKKIVINKKDNVKPGQIYSGDTPKPIPFFKYALITVLCSLMVIFTAFIFLYNTTSYSVIVDINPSLKLQLNRWNKIISCTPLTNEGSKLIHGTEIKNKDLDDGLILILNNARNCNYIDDSFIREKKVISIYISSHNNININIDKFEKKASVLKLNLIVNDNGTETHSVTN